jgi:hypothetical protein
MMKKSNLIGNIGCILLLSCHLNTQSRNYVDSTPAIIIGKPFPNIILNNVAYYSKRTLVFEELIGKPIIIDFWSSYCMACIIGFRPMDSLQHAFRKQVLFLPIGFEDGRIDLLFDKLRSKYHLRLPSAFDSALFSRFKILTVPHTVWIDSKGIVQAITNDPSAISYDHVSQLIEGVRLDWSISNSEQKNQLSLSKPFSWPPLDTTCLFSSKITPYQEGLGSHCGAIKDTATKNFYATNTSLVHLYMVAYGRNEKYSARYPYNKIFLEVADRSRWDDDERKNLFCYSLQAPVAKGDQLPKLMQEDLDHWFGYKSSLETRTVKCLVLTCSDKSSLKSKEQAILFKWSPDSLIIQNRPISDLLYALWYHMQSLPPIVNETNIEGPIDITVNEILSDSKALIKTLKKHHLHLKEEYRKIQVLVIRDRDDPHS